MVLVSSFVLVAAAAVVVVAVDFVVWLGCGILKMSIFLPTNCTAAYGTDIERDVGALLSMEF